jgi:hypothetical protein
MTETNNPGEPPEALVQLAEKLNGGINRDNVAQVELEGTLKVGPAWRPPLNVDYSVVEARVAEMLEAAAEPIQVTKFDGDDFSHRLYSRLGIAPTVYDKVIEQARKFAEENNTTITGRTSISPPEDPLKHLSGRTFSMGDVQRAITGGDTPMTAQDERRCLKPPIGCGKSSPVFSNPTSAAEYRITGLCEDCQNAHDATFEEEDEVQEPCFCKGDDYDVLHLPGTPGCDLACPGHNGSDPEEPIFCDGTCRVQCQYGGNCQPGQCPGPCGR